MQLYDNNYLENLKNKILKMTSIEWDNIYKIIKDENIPYTKNNNGIFINMKDLNKSSIESINNIIKYYETIKLNNEHREKTLELIT